MLSTFLPLILLAYGTSELAGTAAFLPLTTAVCWLLLTWAWTCVLLPGALTRLRCEGRLPGFNEAQTGFSWLVTGWIILLHAVSDPAAWLVPGLYRTFPQAWPMFVSIVLYAGILWIVRVPFRAAWSRIFDPDQTPEEFFRARMTLPILFFPPMLLWMAIEDSWLGAMRLPGLSDLENFVMAPLFFVGLYLFSPNLFNWAWRATPMEPGPLRSAIVDLAARAETPIAGVRQWDTFREPIPNAAVAGLSHKYRFVYMTNYIMEIFDDRQVLAVVAHELGHLRLGHVWTYMIFSLDLVFLSLFAKIQLFLCLPWYAAQAETLNSVVDLVVFLAVFIVFFTALTRHSERQADRFAASLVGGDLFAGTLERLQEFVSPVPSRWPKWTLTHPEFGERTSVARSWNGPVERLVSSERRLRLGLLVLGIAACFAAWPGMSSVHRLAEMADAVSAGHIREAARLWNALPPELKTHPEAAAQRAALAFQSGDWAFVLRQAARASWGDGGPSPDGPISEIPHHAGPPEVALHFEIVQFLLELLDLGRVHGVSLFDKAFDHLQIPLGQR
ncbi:MAG TPA: M48 family metalloprotease [Candidatus Ozemobacteraceae bacterium]|nr:M48 family metalloprotease [Candidatus Ozemobacteraceae bacterium]